jgi:hypothetical protein
MSHTYSVKNGAEVITVAAESGHTARITIEDESGSAALTLSASDLRNFMTVLGVFVEPYPGAWNKLERGEG